MSRIDFTIFTVVARKKIPKGKLFILFKSVGLIWQYLFSTRLEDMMGLLCITPSD
jgi:hypothetical protein